MKALVAVKRVVDYNVKIRVKTDNSGVELANVKMDKSTRFDIKPIDGSVKLTLTLGKKKNYLFLKIYKLMASNNMQKFCVK